MPENLGVAVLELQADASGLEKTLANVEKTSSQKMSSLGSTLTKTLTPAAMAVGAVGVMAFKEWDGAMDDIRAKTGATGKDLEKMGDIVKRVGAQSNQSIGDIGSIVGELNSKLGLTGKPLENLTKQFASLKSLGMEPNIESITRLFGDWGVKTADQTERMNDLFNAAQKTGVPIDNLSTLLVKFGAPLRQFGFSFEESAALLAKFEKEGVNTELVMGSMRIAMGKFAKENIPLREGLDGVIKKIQELGPGAEATALAMETFGARAGPDMAAAILEGKFSIEDMERTLAASKDTINGAAADTMDLGDKITMMKNKMIGAIGPVGELMGVIGAGLAAIGPSLMGLSHFIKLGGQLGGVGANAGIAAKGMNLLGKIPGLGGTTGLLAKMGPTLAKFGPWGIAAGVGIGALAFGLTKILGGASPAEQALKKLGDAMEFIKQNAATVAASLRELAGAELSTERASLNLQRAQQTLAETTKRVGKDGKKSAEELLELKEAKLGVREASHSLTEAQNAEKAAGDKVNQTRDAQKRKTLEAQHQIEELTNATREENRATLEGETRMAAMAGQVVNLGRVNAQIQGNLDAVVVKLKAQAEASGGVTTQAGRAATAVAEFIEKTNRVPNKTETDIILNGVKSGKADLDAIVDKAINVDKQNPDVNVNANTAGAEADLNRVLGIVRALGNEIQIGVNVVANTISGSAGGGLITRGRGWPHDDVPILAARGEAVVNPGQIRRLGGASAMARAGVPGFFAGGHLTGGIADEDSSAIDTSPGPAEYNSDGLPTAIDPEGVSANRAYGTFWDSSRFFSPIGELKWSAYYPRSGSPQMNTGVVPPYTTGLPHVGPAGSAAKGHPLSFPWYDQWWQRGQALKFAKEYSKRSRHGPSKFLERWVKEHDLATKLLGVPIERMNDWEHWPWNAHVAAGAVGPTPGIIPLPRTADARVQRAINYANQVSAQGQDYVFGGGHYGWDWWGPFDCSGFVSSILHFGLGMLSYPQSTNGLYPGLNGLQGGPGKFVTGYTRQTGDPHTSHTFINLAGQLYESGGQRPEPNGAGRTSRSTSGYTPWHPPGFDRGGIVGRDWRRPSARDVIPVMARRGESILTPEQAGRGGAVFNFPNYVGDRRELQRAVVGALTDYEKRNGSYAAR